MKKVGKDLSQNLQRLHRVHPVPPCQAWHINPKFLTFHRGVGAGRGEGPKESPQISSHTWVPFPPIGMGGQIKQLLLINEGKTLWMELGKGWEGLPKPSQNSLEVLDSGSGCSSLGCSSPAAFSPGVHWHREFPAFLILSQLTFSVIITMI